MAWWFDCLLVGLLLMLSALGASPAVHFLRRHPSLPDVRVAALVLVAAGEVVLVNSILNIVTGYLYLVMDVLASRVLEMICPLLLAHASLSYNQSSLSNCDSDDGVEKDATPSGLRCSQQASSDRPCTSTSRHWMKNSVQTPKHPLFSFLAVYLWTVAVLVSAVSIILPGIYPCWSDLDLQTRAQTRTRLLHTERESIGPLDWKPEMNDGAQPGDSKSRLDVKADIRTMAISAESDNSENTTELGTAEGGYFLGYCVLDVTSEILLYFLYYVPLAIFWVAALCCHPQQPRQSHVTDEAKDRGDATPSQDVTTKNCLCDTGTFPQFLGAIYAEPERVPAKTTCSDACTILECSPLPEKSLSTVIRLDVAYALSTSQAAPQTSQTVTEDLELHAAAEEDTGCRVCTQLAPYIVLAGVVMVVQCLVCPILWGGSLWFFKGQLRITPPDVIFLPAYTALCFQYRVLVRAKQTD